LRLGSTSREAGENASRRLFTTGRGGQGPFVSIFFARWWCWPCWPAFSKTLRHANSHRSMRSRSTPEVKREAVRSMSAQPNTASPSKNTRMQVVGLAALVTIALFSWSASLALATSPTLDFHLVSAGGSSMGNNCFRLSGTVGQSAPGYSSGSSNSIFAGFWSAAPATAPDEIHFNGFESC